MKNILKKSVTWLMILLLSVGTIGTFLPGASAEAEAAETPKYMAKIMKVQDETYQKDRLGQFFNVTPGETYTLSYNLYVIKSGNLQAWEHEQKCLLQGTESVSGEVVKKSASYTIPDGMTQLYINFQCSSGEFYIWNLKLTKEGSDTNLLVNADFEEGCGTFMNWSCSKWGGDAAESLSTFAKSESYEQTTGRKVILYNQALLSKIDAEEREMMESTGETPYMAHIGNYWVRIEQYLTVEAGKTYTLEYEYCKTIAGNLQGRVGYVTSDDASGTFKAYSDTSTTGMCKKASVSYTMPEGQTNLFIRFEGTDNNNGVNGYVWNVRLTKEGSDENLLKNADFAQDGGSWIHWNVSGYGTIQNVETSNRAGLEKNCEIISYDSDLFKTDAQLAEWSVQPILYQTLEFQFKTTLKSEPTEVPSMTFVMKDGDETILEKTVQGTAIQDGKNGYRFSLTILPQNMACTIQATLNVADQTQTKIYSAKKYCATLLVSDTTDVYLKGLIADLIRYGSKTQLYLKKTDSITSGLKSVMEGYGNQAVLENATYVTTLLTGDNTGKYKWTNASLVLDGKVTIRFKFTTEDIQSLKVKVNDEEYDIKNSGTYYYVDIPMAATQYADEITAKFYENDTEQGATIVYSVNTYLYRMRNTIPELAGAIYHYGKSAVTYKTYILTGKPDTSDVTTPLDNELKDNWNL